VVEEEIREQVRELEAQSSKCEHLEEEYLRAKKLHQSELATFRRKAKDWHEKQHALLLRLQARVRGWLMRRRFIESISKKLTWHVHLSTLLPNQLDDNLLSLRHSVHDLRFRPQERLEAANRLQAWWRGILGWRLAAVARIARKVRRVTERMAAAATCITRHYRGHCVRMRTRHQLIELRRMKFVCLFSNMSTDLQYIVRIQRCFRKRLAAKKANLRRRRITRVQPNRAHQRVPLSVDLAEGDSDLGIVSMRCARRSTCRAMGATSMERPPRTPRTDHNLQELAAAGLVPFYSSNSCGHRVVRHRIGGPTAVALLTGRGGGPRSRGVSTPFPSLRDDVFLGSLWNLYPAGLSPGFLEGLDEDAWPQDSWGRVRAGGVAGGGKVTKAFGRSAPHGGAPNPAAAPSRPARRRRRLHPVAAAQPPPAHAELRARAREEAAAAGTAAEPPPHPLFENAPPPPLAPLPPPVPHPPPAPTRLSRTPAAPAVLSQLRVRVAEDCSWPGATSICARSRGKTLHLSGDNTSASGGCVLERTLLPAIVTAR